MEFHVKVVIFVGEECVNLLPDALTNTGKFHSLFATSNRIVQVTNRVSSLDIGFILVLVLGLFRMCVKHIRDTLVKVRFDVALGGCDRLGVGTIGFLIIGVLLVQVLVDLG